MNIYRHLILGGTFDRFHAGHRLFIKTAFEKTSGQLTVGVTTETLYKNKPFAQTIESYTDREKNVKNFVAKINKKHISVTVIPISTIYGSSLTDVTIDGIAVTRDTKPGAEAINRKREKAGMKPLDIIEVPLVPAEDGLPISSFRIRYGDIDQEGVSYYKYLVGTPQFNLPEALRTRLREPLGDLYSNGLTGNLQVVNRIMATIEKKKPPMVFTIGDIISQKLADAGYRSAVAVIDHKSRRKALLEEKSAWASEAGEARYRNRAGTIQQGAVSRLKDARDLYLEKKQPQTVVIDGEEDLLALPAILLAPLGSFVLYGQYGEGAVMVRVTEERKRYVWDLLRQFTREGVMTGLSEAL